MHSRACAAFAAAVLVSNSAAALEEVTFGTNWVAQAEHGGFYQALADGTYEECGLKVEILPGGPEVNNRALLAARTTLILSEGCGSYFWVKRLQRGKPSNRGSRLSACFRGSI